MRTWAKMLVFFVCWTILIKYVIPIGWSFRNGAPIEQYIMWDAWPILHVLVAALLIKGKKAAWPAAMTVAVLEILIIVAKLGLYLERPVLTFWRINWAVNKTFLLVYFLLLLRWMLRPRVRTAFRS